MATLRELLGESYRENMTFEEIESVIGGMKLADLSTGEYVSKGKFDDSERRRKDAEKKLTDKMSDDEKTLALQAEREEYYKQLEKENARNKYLAKLGKTIKDEKVLNEIADLYAEGDFATAIDKQNEYLAKYHGELEKTIKADLLRENPQPTPQSGKTTYKTKDEIMAIKDTTTRQQAIAENITLFQ